MLEDFQRYKLTYSIIFLNVLVYLYTAFLSHDIVDMNMEVLVHTGALYGPYVIHDAQWWRLGSAMFLHGGMTHILMNMFSLYLVGRGAENFFSKQAYIVLYFSSGLLGGVASLYMHPDSVGVGASGAIFGIFGALAGFFLAHREKIAQQSKAFMKDFAIIIGINLVLGLSIPSVDVSAHIGGLFVGIVGGYILAKKPQWIWLYSASMILCVWFLCALLSDQYATTLF